MVETQKQQLDASVHSGNSELGSPLTDNSSQCISGATSDLTITTTGKNLVEKGIQTNEHSRNPLDAKHSTSQDSLSKIVAGVSGDDKGVTKDAAHNLSLTESTPGSVQRADEDSLSTTTDRESTGAVASDPESTGTEEVVSASLSSAPLKLMILLVISLKSKLVVIRILLVK
ncbi:hypothetical protein PVT01_000093500 [Plasmodium vivax]|uniref:VIR protein n=1 Tax=Plasmodium vivax TaxID=5855 RepID=A0A1G4E7M3_PLAVI|nr:hypothetical protein PVT01_000093500 [Plasmodium vivax]